MDVNYRLPCKFIYFTPPLFSANQECLEALTCSQGAALLQLLQPPLTQGWDEDVQIGAQVESLGDPGVTHPKVRQAPKISTPTRDGISIANAWTDCLLLDGKQCNENEALFLAVSLTRA